MFRIGLVNGKYGWGNTAYEALVNAIGQKKADILSDFVRIDSYQRGYEIYAKNGVLIGIVEKRA